MCALRLRTNSHRLVAFMAKNPPTVDYRLKSRRDQEKSNEEEEGSYLFAVLSHASLTLDGRRHGR